MNNKKIWEEAEKIIPGGNGLLSKRPQRFLPDGWPIYYKKAKGIYIWDLSLKKYTDFSIMGVGTAILGYANDQVDKKAISAIKASINTTLNSKEEFLLAKEILKYDKFADQVKFAKAGGEAMAIATRIARTNTNKHKIVFCGYHGWHDWYISANLSDRKNLNNHLLQNLNPTGIPKILKNLMIPLKFNDYKSLKEIFLKDRNAGILVIEGARNDYLSKNFVKTLKQVQRKYNIIVIIDEITSGWRETMGGVYKKVGIKPDMVVYGKALGNGYPISAVVGKKNIMKKSNETFISSTAWTERIGFAAALETIKFLKRKNVSKLIQKRGMKIIKNWKILAQKNDLKLKTNNFYSSPSFQFDYASESEKLHTLFTELMLKRGYLATNYMFVTYSHSDREINKYLKNCDKVFTQIKESLFLKKNILKSRIRKMTY